MLGYLRETAELASKAGVDKEFNISRSGLDEYLAIIFPEVNDWVHDKAFSKSIRTRPDYRSDSLKLVIEFDGLPHYMNPDVIRKDLENTKIYTQAGYTVVRIPFFIQLTSHVILKLFDRIVEPAKVFPDNNVVSFSVKSRVTPAYIPRAGLCRMAEEFIKVSTEQLASNLEYLKTINDEFISGYNDFVDVINTLK